MTPKRTAIADREAREQLPTAFDALIPGTVPAPVPEPKPTAALPRKFTMTRTASQRAAMLTVADRLAGILSPAPAESDIYLALGDMAATGGGDLDELARQCRPITDARIAENQRKRLDGGTARHPDV